MKYYEAHDLEYQKRLGSGQVAWDKGEYESFDMLPMIEQCFEKAEFDIPNLRALDLGCGTGALPVFLTQKGFDVTAIDVSKAAINEAKKQAAMRNARIDFQVGDFCRLDLPEESFDLITDNHFMHCIVFEEERRKVLAKIHSILKRGGEFWMETMVRHPEMKPRPEWNLDPEGITWAAVDEEFANSYEDCKRSDGEIWFPIRRIHKSSQILIDELKAAHLDIIWHETKQPIDENDTGTFRARCCRRE